MVWIGKAATALAEAVLRKLRENARARFQFTILIQQPHQLLCDYLSSAMARRDALQAVRGVAANEGYAARSKITAEFESLVMQGLVDCRPIKLNTV
jgi:hypothetical protein